jgi:hypothetical protein
MKKLFVNLCLLLFILLVSCDSTKINREKFQKQQIMIDQNKNYWLVKHSFGDNYTLEYLGDSTLFIR